MFLAFLMCLVPVVDILHGVLIFEFNTHIPLAAAFKGALLIICGGETLLQRRGWTTAFLAVIWFAVIAFSHGVEEGPFDPNLYDWPATILLGLFVYELFSRDAYLRCKARRIIDIQMGIIVLALVLNLVGYGTPTYQSTNTGMKSYFYAGNELAAAYFLLASAIFATGSSPTSPRELLKFAVFVLFGILIGTKISSGGLLLYAACLVGFSFLRLGSNLRARPILHFLVASLPAGLLALFLFSSEQIFYDLDVVERSMWALEHGDLMAVIFAGRLDLISDQIPRVMDAATLMALLFGIGRGDEALVFYPGVESDIVDVFVYFGLVGLAFLLLWVRKMHRDIVCAGLVWNAHLKAVLLLVMTLVLSLISGHIWTSATVAITVAITMAAMQSGRGHYAGAA